MYFVRNQVFCDFRFLRVLVNILDPLVTLDPNTLDIALAIIADNLLYESGVISLS